MGTLDMGGLAGAGRTRFSAMSLLVAEHSVVPRNRQSAWCKRVARNVPSDENRGIISSYRLDEAAPPAIYRAHYGQITQRCVFRTCVGAARLVCVAC